MTGSAPTQAGFVQFLRNVAQISTANLPDNSPVIPVAYAVAIEIVNFQLLGASVLIYELAVYNLATSNLLSYAPDLPPPATPNYFSNLRTKWNILDFISGVVQSTSDNGSSESMVVMEAAQNFTLGNLQNLKDPYGRQYLAFAQDAGTIWGLS